jgi:hypothetical protein
VAAAAMSTKEVFSDNTPTFTDRPWVCVVVLIAVVLGVGGFGLGSLAVQRRRLKAQAMPRLVEHHSAACVSCRRACGGEPAGRQCIWNDGRNIGVHLQPPSAVIIIFLETKSLV